MPSPNQITASQLKRLVGLPDAPTIIDVRIDADFDEDPRLLPGSFRHSHESANALSRDFRGQKPVIVCQKGLKLSQGTAAILRNFGIRAQVLEGGFEAWRNAGAPLVPFVRIPPRNHEGCTVWVTRQRPKIDRVACPWLIRRFVDPKAKFLFVEPTQVLAVAEKFDATPFDVEGVFWTHRGEYCSFDTMVAEFGLASPAMERLATVVRAADTDRHALSPQAAGLLAISLGLSRMFRDDVEQVNAGMGIYDALYRWARDAFEEGHDWPAGRIGSGT